MADVLMMATVAGFFALCVAYVRVCDRIIGPDPVPTPDATAPGVARRDEAEVSA